MRSSRGVEDRDVTHVYVKRCMTSSGVQTSRSWIGHGYYSRA